MNLAGHAWTLGGRLRAMIAAPQPPPAEPWSTELVDPVVGTVRLSGWLSVPAGATNLVVLVHGLGGSTRSLYMIEAARAVVDAGHACLRLNLRGADESGEDYYHAGLSADLTAALAAPALAAFERIVVMGFSLGGHLSLCWGCAPGPDPRVRAVAAVCAPLDLGATQPIIDGPSAWFYRRYLLRNLLRCYGAVAARRPVPLAPALAARLDNFLDFDTQIVAPRHGFADAHDYYRRTSVAARWSQLGVPALLVAAEGDPLIPGAVVRPYLPGPGVPLEVRWAPRGGHVGFPRDLDLGQPGRRGLYCQLAAWASERLA